MAPHNSSGEIRLLYPVIEMTPSPDTRYWYDTSMDAHADISESYPDALALIRAALEDDKEVASAIIDSSRCLSCLTLLTALTASNIAHHLVGSMGYPKEKSKVIITAITKAMERAHREGTSLIQVDPKDLEEANLPDEELAYASYR